MASEEERQRIMAEYMASVGNDDDDDEEADFNPDLDDDDDDDDDDEHEESEEDGVTLKGKIGMNNDDNRLVFSGLWLSSTDGTSRKFKLKSKQQKMPLHFNLSMPTVNGEQQKQNLNQPPRMRTITFDGFFVSAEGNKIKERDVNITFSTTSTTGGGPSKKQVGNKSSSDENEDDDDVDYDDDVDTSYKKPAAALKGGDDDDNDDGGKMPSKPPPSTAKTAASKKDDDDDKKEAIGDSKQQKVPSSTEDEKNNSKLSFGIYGHGTNEYGNFEFQGTLDGTNGEMVCRKRYVQSSSSTAAGGGAASKKDVDDEEDGGADEGVDYNELIALHQDAGLPVDELRKRYRESNADAGNCGGGSDNKRSRRQIVQDDDDDDEAEFDGF